MMIIYSYVCRFTQSAFQFDIHHSDEKIETGVRRQVVNGKLMAMVDLPIIQYGKPVSYQDVA